MRKSLALFSLMLGTAALPAMAANELILNEANCVSGDGNWLKGTTTADTGLIGARIEGNGQNWIELVVAGETDAVNHTVDLRGYELRWKFNKDASTSGTGVIKFRNVSEWAAVKKGTIITISEAKEVWYGTGTDKPRNGWINGYGSTKGTLSGTKIDLQTNTSFNAVQTNGDWNKHYWAGGLTGAEPMYDEVNDAFYAESEYFDFYGENPDGVIGETEDAGLFVVNNDNWGFRVYNASGVAVTPWVGEADTGWYNASSGVGNDEMLKLEKVSTVETGHATYDYQTNYANSLMRDGRDSSMGKENRWDSTSTLKTQDLSSLRSWAP